MKRIETNLLVAHADFIRGVARGLVRDAAAADDVAQQVFLAAIENPPKRPDSILSWLAAVTANLGRKHLRSEGRRADHERRTTREETAPPTAGIVAKHELIRQVAEAVSSLDEPYRTAILLRYYDELTPTQIAEQLDVRLDTIKSRLRRAREKLATRLDRVHESRSAWVGGLATLAAAGVAAPGSGIGSDTGDDAGASLAADTASTPSNASRIEPGLEPRLAPHIGPAAWLTGAAAITTGVVVLFLLLSRERPSPDAHPTESVARSADVASAPSANAANAGDRVVDIASRGNDPSRAAEASDVSTGALELHVVFDSDGTPAAGVRARIEPYFTSLPSGPQMRFETDEHGVLRADGLAPGRKSVTIGRCHTSTAVDVLAGETTSATIRLPAGRRVSGIVSDLAGTPVRDAVIFLFRYEFDPGYAVARTDATGRFDIRDVSAGCWIGARHRTLTPSENHLSLGFKTGNEELALILGDEGGRVTGTVVDPSGTPARGAIVHLGTRARGTSCERADGSVGLEPPSPAVRTDDDGRFEFCAVAASEVRIVAMLPGAAAAHESVEVRAGTTCDVTLHVGSGVRVEGTILDVDGDPAEGALVRVRSVAIDTIASALETHTTSDGTFTIDLLPAGDLWIEATGSSGRGVAGTRRNGNPGETIRWEARLSDGNRLEGRVVGPDDAPLAGWIVRGRAAGTALPQCSLPPTSDRWDRESPTDADGRFVLTNCPPGALRIDVISPATDTDSGGSVVAAERRDLLAGEGFVVIRLAADDLPDSSVTGRLMPRVGVPIAGLPVMAHRPSDVFPQRFTTQTDLEGRFRFDPLLAGTYVLATRHEHDHDVVLGEVTVARGEERDVGTLHVSPPGRMSGICERHGIELSDRPDVRIYDAFGMPVRPATLHGDTIEPVELEPGRYTLRFNGFARDPVAATMIPFEVRPGDVTELDVDLYAGAARTFCLHESAEVAGHATRVRFHVIDGDGALVWEGIVRRVDGPKHGEAFRMRAYLTPGSYTAEAVTDAGTRGTAAFEVRSVDEPIASVCIEAR